MTRVLLLAFMAALPLAAAGRVDVTLELNLQTNFDNTVVEARFAGRHAAGEARIPQFREPATNRELVVVLLDQSGKERERQVVADPSLIHSEDFDPQTGRIRSARTLYREDSLLRLSLPDDYAGRLVLYRPRFGDSETTLEYLTEVALDQTSASHTFENTYNVATVIDNGDPADRVDIVFMGDGYTAAQQGQFAADIQSIAGSYFNIEPYNSYSNFFNVHRIDVVSNQSGVDHPELGVYKDTALNSGYYCFNIQRLICADNAIAENIAAAHLAADARDILVVVVNDNEYGGSGGAVAVISTNGAAVDLALHEIGHSYGLLADEYTTNPELCNTSEPSEPNSTTITNRNTTKWAHWIDGSTPIPTPTSYGNTPGLYTGSRYCSSGMYRPTDNSMMRSLGQPFDAINEEALVKRFYQYTNPSDAVSPSAGTVNLSGSQTFTVTPAPVSTVQTDWYLDNVYQSTGNSITLNSASLSSGNHALRAEVNDTTTKVRYDPSDLLEQTISWTLVVGSGGGGCTQAPPVPTGLASSNVASTSFTAVWNAAPQATSYDLQLWINGAWQNSGSTSDTSYTFTGLASGSTQYVHVRATNSCGSSDYSGWIQVDLTSGCTGAPGVPTGLASSNVGDTGFTATWNAVSGATGYDLQLWVNGAWQNAGSSTDTSHTFTGLTSGSTQYVRVRAVNGCGSGDYSGWIQVDLTSGCTGAPATPAGLSATRLSSTSFRADWNAVAGATGYKLQLWNGSAWYDAGTTSGTTFTFTGLSSGSTQYVHVRATNSCGESNDSGWISVQL